MFWRVFSLLLFRTYDALIGIVTHDYFDELSDSQVRRGLSLEQRDKMFQTFVRNQYNAHLQAKSFIYKSRDVLSLLESGNALARGQRVHKLVDLW